MMAALRGALLRLRPPDVDELGLAASLQGLVAAWNTRGGGRTRFSIELSGEFGTLSPDFAASLYRVAQEAITNAAKHAQASRVTLRLRMQEAAGPDQRAQIEIDVDDDVPRKPKRRRHTARGVDLNRVHLPVAHRQAKDVPAFPAGERGRRRRVQST